MKKFEIGKTYTMTSPCDRNCVWTYTVTKRTAKSITISDGTETKTCRVNAQVSEYRDAESIFPLGRYSMCPVLSADKEEMPEVQEPSEEAEVETKIITFPKMKKLNTHPFMSGRTVMAYVSAARFVSRMVEKYGANRVWVWDVLADEFNIIKGAHGIMNQLEVREAEHIIKSGLQ